MKTLKENYLEKLKRPENKQHLANFRQKQRQDNAKYRQKKLKENRKEFLNKRAAQTRKCRERKKRASENVDPNEGEEKSEEENDDNDRTAENIHRRSHEQSLPEGFHTKSALRKAVQRAAKNLPKNPLKEKAVVQILADRLLITPTASSSQKDSQLRSRRQKTYEQTYDVVKSFYECDSISKQMPGRKDYMTIKGVQHQKRVMMKTVDEAFEDYLKSYKEYPLSRSKFFELRPAYVLPSSDAAHYTCCCGICADIEYLFESIKNFFNQISLKSFITEIVCSRSSFACMTSSCETCNFYEMLNACEAVGEEGNKMIKVLKWDKGENGFMQKNIKSLSFADALSTFKETLPKFLLHKYLVDSQHQVISLIKSSLQWNELTIHGDFSENQTSICQNDTQAAYFGRNQISLFTAIAYLGTDKPRSYVFINEDTSHSKEQVYFYIAMIINEMKKVCPELAHVNFVSDGCASQFKNKFILSSLLLTYKDFGVTSEWHFSPTSHGKGAVDGLGGTLKRNVRNRVLASNAIVYSAQDFYECAMKFAKNIKLRLIDQGDVDKLTKETLAPRWEKLKKFQLRMTRDFHFFKADYDGKQLIAARSSHGDGQKKFPLPMSFFE